MIRMRASSDSALAISTSCCSPMRSAQTGGSGRATRRRGEQPLRVARSIRAFVERAVARHALAAEKEIGGDVELRHEVELLRDDHDARRVRFARVGEAHGLTGQRDRALVVRDDARKHVHQRALARAVLAEQDVDLARVQVEIDAAQRAHPAEAFLDPPHLQQGGDHAGTRETGCESAGPAIRFPRRSSASKPATMTGVTLPPLRAKSSEDRRSIAQNGPRSEPLNSSSL